MNYRMPKMLILSINMLITAVKYQDVFMHTHTHTRTAHNLIAIVYVRACQEEA